jgi:GDP-D-mannose dehydratase
MVGSAIWRTLTAKGYTNLIGASSKELDLRNQQAVKDFMAAEKPEVIIDAAAKVGGILANNHFPYQFIMENMQIQNNLIDTALQSVVACSNPLYQIAIGTVVLRVDPEYYRPTEVDLLIGDPTKSKTQLGWKPQYDLDTMIKEMVASDLKLY